MAELDIGELRGRIAESLRPHAPGSAAPDWLPDAVLDSRPLEMVVLSADIRLSTLLMKEAVDLQHFAEVVSDFMDECQRKVFARSGFFDKFTGDGFLAYWLPESLNVFDDDDGGEALQGRWHEYLDSQLRPPDQRPEENETSPYSRRYETEASEYEQDLLAAVDIALSTAAELLTLFNEFTLRDFRSQSRNLSGGVGLSIGIDFGEVQLMPVARQFTIIGSPVVGAVRMVSAARPWEVLVNVYPGELLNRFPERVEHKIEVRQLLRPTKEYMDSEVYSVSFPRLPIPKAPGES